MKNAEMEKEEFLTAVCNEIYDGDLKTKTRQELNTHITDQYETYVAEGMQQEKAMHEAVRQMGDAVQTGKDINSVYHPKPNIKMVGLSILLGIAAADDYIGSLFDPPSFITVVFAAILLKSLCDRFLQKYQSKKLTLANSFLLSGVLVFIYCLYSFMRFHPLHYTIFKLSLLPVLYGLIFKIVISYLYSKGDFIAKHKINWRHNVE